MKAKITLNNPIKNFDYKGGKITELVFASMNANKVEELKKLSSLYKVGIRAASKFIKELPSEDGETFEENAAIKAIYVCQKTGLPSLGDDSGLCVNALEGAPGVYSARWAGEQRDFSIAINKIERLLKGSEDRSAKFVTVLALALPDREGVITFRGEIEGELVFPPRGKAGFGYDSVFLPKGIELTFAQMSFSQKNEISHRTLAFTKFAKTCLELKTKS